jgi:hypothetical protein
LKISQITFLRDAKAVKHLKTGWLCVESRQHVEIKGGFSPELKGSEAEARLGPNPGENERRRSSAAAFAGNGRN